MAAKLEVQVIGDASSLQRALRQSSSAADSFGSKMASAGKVIGKAALGVGAAVTGGMIVTLKRGFDELAESQKVMAQTEAALKSTGGVANVTAKDVEGLASSLSAMSGVDDEVIQASENLLLTFKNVRNEAGKGNKVFDEATKAALNLSVAGFGSLESTSKMLGKALNDPIKGMTAMGRAGVTFSQDQKKAIEAMVETGDLLGAQKVILQEVESQVGGSAKAYGETLPGQLAKARNAFDEIAGKVAERFLPALTSALDWVNSNWPTIERVIDAAATAIIWSFQAIGASITWLRGQWEAHRATVMAVWGAIESAVRGTIEWFRANVVPAIQNVVTAAQALWERFGSAISSIARTYFGVVVTIVRTVMQNIKSAIEIITALIRGDWGKAWDEIKAIVGRTLGLVWKVLKGAVSIALELATAVGSAILDGVKAGLKGLVGKVRDGMQWLWNWLTQEAPGLAKDAAVAIGAGIWDGIVAGFKATFSSDALSNAIREKVDQANANVGSTAEQYASRTIGAGIGSGVVKGTVLSADAKAAELRAAGRRVVANLAAGVASQFPMLASISKQIAATLGSSFDSPEAVAQAKAGAAKIANALKANAPLIASAGKVLGEKTTREIIAGVIGVAPSLAQQLKTAIGSAVQEAMAKAKEKVQEARAGLSAAFADAASAALAAFDAVTAAWQPPSLLKAQREREEREAAQLKQTIADAQAAIQASMGAALAASNQLAALGTAPPPGMDPEEWQKQVDAANAVIAKASEDIKAAQATLDNALFQQRQAMLEKKAEQERRDWEESRERKRVAFENDLAALERWAQKNVGKHRELGEKLKELWEKYGIQGQKWGKNFGEKIANGIEESIPAIIEATKLVAQAIADNLKTGSPTKEGPLSKFDMRDAGYDLMALYSKGIEAASSGLVSNALAGVVGGRGSYPAAGGGGGGGGSTVNVYVSGSVLSERDLVTAVRQGLIREGRRTGPNLLGGYA